MSRYSKFCAQYIPQEEDEMFYRLERSLPHRGLEWRTIAQSQRYVDELLQSEFWVEKFPEIKKVEVIEGPYERTFAIWDIKKHKRIIEVGGRHYCELSTLHEMAHFGAFTKGDFGHGLPFKIIFEIMIKEFICPTWSIISPQFGSTPRPSED